MRSLLLFVAFLTAGNAWAEPLLTAQLQNTIPADYTIKPANIMRSLGPAQKPYVVLKKTSRLPASVDQIGYDPGEVVIANITAAGARMTVE